jgi:hypothetical protein
LLCYWPYLYKLTVSEWLELAMANKALTKFDESSIALHGYFSKVIDDYFVPSGVPDQKSAPASQKAGIEPSRERAELFWNWFKDNHTYESGTIMTHLRPEIRAGHCIVVRQGNTDNFKEYLVEQISHQYNVHPTPQFTTSYQVTRGQKAERFKSYILGGTLQ